MSASDNYMVVYSDRECREIVDSFPTMETAKRFLSELLYHPPFRHTPVYLDLSEDGLEGEGFGEDGYFTYSIISL